MQGATYNLDLNFFQGARVFSECQLSKLYLEDIEAGEDVFMFEETHHLELPEDTLAADEALKNVG